MQDFDLTIRPESKLRFRLGYSRNVDEGPASDLARRRHGADPEPELSRHDEYLSRGR